MVKTTIFCLIGLVIAAYVAPSRPPVYQDQHGNSYRIDEIKGQLTILDFAASWCKPCWRALPHIEALAKNNPSIRVLVINLDDRVSGRDKLVKKLGLTVPVIWDQNHAWAEIYKPQAMPTTLILDKQGKVVYRHEGFSEKSWQKFLTELKNHQK